MTLSSLEADLYRRLGYDATPATETTTRLRAFLNETHRELLSLPGLERTRDDLITVATVADQEFVALPQSVARVKSIVDRTNDQPLVQVDTRFIRRTNPQQFTGNPERYGVIGHKAVAQQPSDASAVLVDSTAAGDTTQTAYIEGVRTGGHRETASVTLTGTTAVAFSPTHTDWIQVDKFYLDGTAAGTVTLVEDADGGTVLSTIAIGNLYARYLHLLLDPVPSSAITLHVDYVREIEDMANANDEPLLPPDFHRLLGVGARMKEYERRLDNVRYRQAQTEFLLGVRALKFWIHTEGGTLANVRAPRQWSQLGPNYPPGS